jgi:hypothetical protein
VPLDNDNIHIGHIRRANRLEVKEMVGKSFTLVVLPELVEQ